MNVTGNTILITGGGTGIGRGLAEAFYKQDNQVIIAGRRKSVLDEVVQANPGMRAYELDVADAADIERFVSEVKKDFPKLNVVIHDAGVMKSEDIKAGKQVVPIAEEAVVTNLLGPIRLTAALIPNLLEQSQATIMTISGGVAFVPMAVSPTYSATKAAIHSWTQCLTLSAAGGQDRSARSRTTLRAVGVVHTVGRDRSSCYASEGFHKRSHGSTQESTAFRRDFGEACAHAALRRTRRDLREKLRASKRHEILSNRSGLDGSGQ